MLNVTEQRLMNQQSQLRKRQWLTNLQLDEIQRRIEDEQHNYVPNESEKEDGQLFLGFNQKGGDAILKDVRMVEKIGNPG